MFVGKFIAEKVLNKMLKKLHILMESSSIEEQNCEKKYRERKKKSCDVVEWNVIKKKKWLSMKWKVRRQFYKIGWNVFSFFISFIDF